MIAANLLTAAEIARLSATLPAGWQVQCPSVSICTIADDNSAVLWQIEIMGPGGDRFTYDATSGTAVAIKGGLPMLPPKAKSRRHDTFCPADESKVEFRGPQSGKS